MKISMPLIYYSTLHSIRYEYLVFRSMYIALLHIYLLYTLRLLVVDYLTIRHGIEDRIETFCVRNDISLSISEKNSKYYSVQCVLYTCCLLLAALSEDLFLPLSFHFFFFSINMCSVCNVYTYTWILLIIFQRRERWTDFFSFPTVQSVEYLLITNILFNTILLWWLLLLVMSYKSRDWRCEHWAMLLIWILNSTHILRYKNNNNKSMRSLCYRYARACMCLWHERARYEANWM